MLYKNIYVYSRDYIHAPPSTTIKCPNFKMVVQLETTFPASLSPSTAMRLSSGYEVCHSPLSRINVCSPGPFPSCWWLGDGSNWNNNLTHRDEVTY